MTLQDVLNHLTYGEFSHLFIGSGAAGEGMPDGSIQKILPALELGLAELHKRFLLHERRITLTLNGNASYVLHTDFADSNGDAVSPYINDTADPFLDDLVKVERILDDDGEEVALNKLNDDLAIRTTQYNVLSVPADLDTTTIVVVYRATHPALDVGLAESNPDEVTINLPFTHMTALLNFMAGRVTTPMGASGEFHQGNNYMAKFEAACVILRNEGMQLDTDHGNEKLENNGWV